jgi:hypothetical protein
MFSLCKLELFSTRKEPPERLAGGWCSFVLREKLDGGWFVPRENYYSLVAHMPNEQAV